MKIAHWAISVFTIAATAGVAVAQTPAAAPCPPARGGGTGGGRAPATGNASTLNGQNNVESVNGLQKNWNLGFTLALTPSEKFSAQLGYNYNAISSQILICYTSSAALPGLPACPNLPGLLQHSRSTTAR